MRSTHRRLALRASALSALVVALAALGATGCSSNASEAPPATAESAMTRAPVAQGSHGMVRWVGEALGDVPLGAEQRKQIEALAKDAEARHAPVRAAREAVAEELAKEIEQGQLDRAALGAKVDAAAAAAETARPDDRAAFEKLHAILDASQRTALVDALERRGKDKAQGHAAHARIAEWAADLKLTEAQRDQIRDAVRASMEKSHGAGIRAFRAHMDHGKQTLEAFKGETFSMNEVAPTEDMRAHAREMSGKIADFVEVVLPILTPEQRTIAATKIREHAAEGGEDLAP